MDIIIKDVDIITLKDDKPLIKKGNIKIKNNKIVLISEYKIKDNNAQVIDGKNKIALPGLVNSHTHVPMLLLRNYADDLPLKKWLFEKMFPLEDKFSAEDIYWASLLGIAEMIMSGTTCFADMYMAMDKIAQAVYESGIRANLSRGLQCFEEQNDYSKDVRINECISLYKNWHLEGDNRIRIGFGPHSIYTCVETYLKYSIEVAKKYNTSIHIHVAETEEEYNNCVNKTGLTPIEYLYKIGAFNIDCIAAHCVYVTDKDIKILKDNNVNVVYNPSSNLKLGSGIAPIHKLSAQKINISLGTDGASSNNNLNMFEEMHVASLLSKGILKDTTVMKAKDVIKMATVNGSAALGFKNESALIEEGNKADIILVDKDKVHLKPVHNYYSALVYSAQGSDVDTVIVNGKLLMKDRELITIDIERVMFNINNIVDKLF